MRLLLDENAPKEWLTLLSDLGHEVEHVVDSGLGGSSDRVVFAYALDHGQALLTRNKFRRGPDRRDALKAMMGGLQIICVTVRELERQRLALQQCTAKAEDAFNADPSLRRVTIMNDFRLRLDNESAIRRTLEGA